MTLTGGGLLGIGMTPSNVLDITQTQNAASTISITNASAGASARSQLSLGGAVSIFTSSSGYSPTGPYAASQFVIQSYATNGLLFIAQNSGAPIIFGINTAEVARFDTSGNFLPGANNSLNLGSATMRWATVYTGDLDLNNGVGNWTIVEGEEDLFIYNNKSDKVYKFNLTEVDPATATPKKE
jgi:hypothetical protein